MKRDPPELTQRQHLALDMLDEEWRVVGWFSRPGLGVVVVVEDLGHTLLVLPSGEEHEVKRGPRPTRTEEDGT